MPVQLHLPNFAYSSTVFFSPTLKPSVVAAWRSSSAELAMLYCKAKLSNDRVPSGSSQDKRVGTLTYRRVVNMTREICY